MWLLLGLSSITGSVVRVAPVYTIVCSLQTLFPVIVVPVEYIADDRICRVDVVASGGIVEFVVG
jgi:hypothetical protein